MSKKKVLIICTGNVARSQMAEGFLRHDAGDRFEAFSAGLHPSYVRPKVIQVMAELGIDISHHRSKSVEEFAGQEMDYVITVCDHAKLHCPDFPAKVKKLHWSVDDPVAPFGDEAAQLATFRRVRDDIRRRLREFVEEETRSTN
jgi:arsenate reductase (thioredoxin)